MMKWRSRSGSATIATVVALTLLLWMGGMLARLVKTENDMSINFRDGIAAQYVAEAGLRRALVVLYNSNSPTGLNGLYENISRSGLAGSYRVTSTAEGSAQRVRSIGQVGSAKRSVSVLVEISLESAPGLPLTEWTILHWGN